jgi:hypothetical protein
MISVKIDGIEYNFREVFLDITLMEFIKILSVKSDDIDIMDYQLDIVKRITELDDDILDKLDYRDFLILFNRIIKYPDLSEVKINPVVGGRLIKNIEYKCYEDLKITRADYKKIYDWVRNDLDWLLKVPTLFYNLEGMTDDQILDWSISIKIGDVLPFIIKVLDVVQIQLKSVIMDGRAGE